MISPEAVQHLRGVWDLRHFIGERADEFCRTRSNWTRWHRGPPNTHLRVRTCACSSRGPGDRWTRLLHRGLASQQLWVGIEQPW